MPVGTLGTVKGIRFEELESPGLDARIILEIPIISGFDPARIRSGLWVAFINLSVGSVPS